MNAAEILPADDQLFINRRDGVTDEAARAAVTSVTDQFPSAKVQDQIEFKNEIVSQIGQALNILYALLALAILIALIGIANTLALSVLERTREIGLMRAVGMTRRQVRKMVRWESVIVALLGTFLGLVIGIAFGWALVQAIEEYGVNTFSIPVGRMVTIVLVAFVAGILAAIGPARRASRLNIIRAISSE